VEIQVGNNRLMKYIALSTLFGLMSLAPHGAKPACNAKIQGQFWPEAANSDRFAARKLFQSGELEMCSLAVWKYRWEHISVNIRGLERPQRSVNSGSVTSESRSEGAAATR
jgi:hypothetical protein